MALLFRGRGRVGVGCWKHDPVFLKLPEGRLHVHIICYRIDKLLRIDHMMGHSEIDPTFKEDVRDDRSARSVETYHSRMRGITEEIIKCLIDQTGSRNDHYIRSAEDSLVVLGSVESEQLGFIFNLLTDHCGEKRFWRSHVGHVEFLASSQYVLHHASVTNEGDHIIRGNDAFQ